MKTLVPKDDINGNWQGRSALTPKDILKLYLGILTKKGIYFHLDDESLKVVYKRYKELGGSKEFDFA